MSIETHTRTPDVLIVYDNVRAGKRAKELCDRLGQRLVPDSALNFSAWSLSALGLPPVAQAAAREAESAALLIVAINGDKNLPQAVKNGLHRCACGIHTAGGAIVAQLHGILKMNEELCQACGCLRQIAHHAGVDFFSEVVQLSEDELDRSLEAIHERARPNTSLLEVILPRH
jgi:hypothetical protein